MTRVPMPGIIAHRGASYDAPENTLSAVRLGWEQGADAVEIDVRLSSDGAVVVIHDDDTRRTAGRDGAVAGQTLSELRALDAGRWKNVRFAGEKIPLLEEVIETIPSGKRLVIELKCGTEILPPLANLLRRFPDAGEKFTVIAFSYATLVAAKGALPGIETYWLNQFTVHSQMDQIASPASEIVRAARTAGFDGINLDFSSPINATFVASVRAAGMRCYAWTVDDPTEARRLVTAGIDAITTNRPGWLRAQLEAGG